MHWPARWGWFGGASAVTRVGAAVAEYGPDFVLHLGDVVYPKGKNSHYRSGFFMPFAAALREAPFYAVLGNHDLMDSGGLPCLANLRADSPAYRGDGRNFSFARGAVRVIGLDCNSDYTGERVGPGHPAHTFLIGQLQKCEEPWIVVASHFPIRSQSRQGNRADLMLSLLPELATYGVALYVSGHDHCYQRFGEPGGESPVLVVSGGGGKDLYDVHPVQLGPRAAALAKAWHWCCAETTGDRMGVEARGLDGALLDRFELALPTGEVLDRIRVRSPVRAARIERLRR
jgi:3',5'-cyclic AMP phosphodiesterase CpdA